VRIRSLTSWGVSTRGSIGAMTPMKIRPCLEGRRRGVPARSSLVTVPTRETKVSVVSRCERRLLLLLRPRSDADGRSCHGISPLPRRPCESVDETRPAQVVESSHLRGPPVRHPAPTVARLRRVRRSLVRAKGRRGPGMRREWLLACHRGCARFRLSTGSLTAATRRGCPDVRLGLERLNPPGDRVRPRLTGRWAGSSCHRDERNPDRPGVPCGSAPWQCRWRLPP
jgi:hypothetical protein